MDLKGTPVFINNRNRLETLISLVSWLEKMRFQNIFIIDNDSTYEPLLDYYKKISHKVILLKENIGYLALWESELYDQFKRDYFIYTDSDVVPIDECPGDFMEVFMKGLEKYSKFQKVGFSLKIDDLPSHCKARDHIISHESIFWKTPLDSMYFDAAVDTTFALYRPNTRGGFWAPAIRTAPPYVARHLPWYQNSDHPTPEEIFCKQNSAPTSSYWTSRI